MLLSHADWKELPLPYYYSSCDRWHLPWTRNMGSKASQVTNLVGMDGHFPYPCLWRFLQLPLVLQELCFYRPDLILMHESFFFQLLLQLLNFTFLFFPQYLAQANMRHHFGAWWQVLTHFKWLKCFQFLVDFSQLILLVKQNRIQSWNINLW